MRIIILHIIVLFTFQLGFAQTGNHIFSGSCVDIFKSGNSFDSKSFKMSTWQSSGDVVSDYNGNLLFSFSGRTLRNSSHQIIRSYSDQSIFSLNTSSIIKIHDSLYLSFFEVYDSTRNGVGFGHLNYIKINFSKGGIYADSVSTSFYPLVVKGLTTIEDTTGGSWLVCRTGNSEFTSFYFRDTCFACKTYVSDYGINKNPQWYNNWGNVKLNRSPSGNLLATYNTVRYFDTLQNQYYEDMSSTLFDFDKMTGEVKFKDTINYSKSNLLVDSLVYGIYDLAISNNDSVLFETFILSGIKPGIRSKFYITKQSLNSKPNKDTLISTEFIDSTSMLFNKKIGSLRYYSDGDLYFLSEDNMKSSKDPTIIRMNQISNSNSVLNSDILFSKYAVNAPFSTHNHFYSSYSKYNYINISKKINYQCNATINFENNSELALPETQVNFYIRNLNDEIDFVSVDATKPLTFQANGNYLLKVILKSNKANYKEIHYDTIKIRIPEKPVAAFTASDTLACRFAPVQFFNTSRFNAVKPGEKVIFLWDFGDGESLQTSSTLTFSHAYVKAGTYTASLTILNGYCDSTLIRNAYIRITDAPNPGFTVSAQQGCAPLSVLFIDTVLHNVTRKEYFYSDSELWKPVVSTQFNHTFDTPGQFYAVQRLYGNTGCITQTDTQYFYVSQGLTSNDTSHTSLATYNGNQSIKIEWDTLDAAVLYALYKSNDGMLFPNSPYAITSSNSFSDPINSPGPLAYKVKGIDSCGNYSASGHIAKPVLLTGKALPDNSAAILSFTPYEQWQDTQIQYTLSYRDNNQWLDLTEQQQFHQFKDPNYARTDAFEKCYRIRASNNSLHSLSNEICIPYMPFVFMPNAFSPNDDGLNDAFKPLVYGLTSVKISIYNRWGEKLTDLSLGEAWQPKDIMPGAYVVTFTGKAHNGKDFFLKETVWVVR
jgi:hypothetical protein